MCKTSVGAHVSSPFFTELSTPGIALGVKRARLICQITISTGFAVFVGHTAVAATRSLLGVSTTQLAVRLVLSEIFGGITCALQGHAIFICSPIRMQCAMVAR